MQDIDLEIVKLLDKSSNTFHNTLFYKLFKNIPNRFNIGKVNLNIENILLENDYLKSHITQYNENYSKEYKKFYGEIVFKHPHLQILITLHPQGLSNYEFLTVSCYYNSEEDIKTILPIFEENFYYEKNEELNKIFLIKSTKKGLETTKLDLPKQTIDVENYYNDDFHPIFNKVVERLSKENDNGLVLLHGIMGSGKSSLIKHLTKVVKDKKFIFIPSYMTNVIANPDFTNFIMEHKNSILVLEDSETILMKREITNGSSQAVSNILNLTDGILADGLNIQIIATFNTDLKNLDEALLRKGRLIAKYEFKELEVNKCNKIFEDNEVEFRTNSPMTLAEVFNIDDKIGMVEKVVKNKIGF